MLGWLLNLGFAGGVSTREVIGAMKGSVSIRPRVAGSVAMRPRVDGAVVMMPRVAGTVVVNG